MWHEAGLSRPERLTASRTTRCILAIERVRQLDTAESCRDRGVVKLAQLRDADSEWGDEGVRDDSDAILEALAVAYDEGTGRQVDVLDAHSQRFQQAQPAAVKQGSDGAVWATQMIQNSAHLLAGEYDRKALGAPSARDVAEPRQVDAQDPLVEEEDGGERLCLGGRGDVARGREMGEVGLDLGATHCLRMLAAVKLDISNDPSDILFFGSIAVVALVDFGADVVEEE